MSATIKLTLIDYRVREYLDDWRSNLMLTQYTCIPMAKPNSS